MENKKLREEFEDLKKRFEEELKKAQKENDRLKDDIKLLNERRISQTSVMPFAIKRGHLQDKVIVFGLAANRPTDGDAVNIHAWFSTDTSVMSLWTGTAWVTETFT